MAMIGTNMRWVVFWLFLVVAINGMGQIVDKVHKNIVVGNVGWDRLLKW
jgi:Na+-transporting methylmalonyl-CoA/oxaloacetate decarboxylase gamma subunit